MSWGHSVGSPTVPKTPMAMHQGGGLMQRLQSEPGVRNAGAVAAAIERRIKAKAGG